MSGRDELPAGFDIDSLSIEELARLQGVRPITSLDDLDCGVAGSTKRPTRSSHTRTWPITRA